MLTCKPFQLPSSSRIPQQGLRCRPCPEQLARGSRPSNVVTNCSLPDDKTKARNRSAARQVITLNVSGDLNVVHNVGGQQPVQWDALAISDAAKALLQRNGVKASTALKMHRMLGFEDVDDIQRLTPDLISQMKLKPLQLAPLLNMLREHQGLHSGLLQQTQINKQHDIKLPELSGISFMAFSRDGRRALSCSQDDELHAWDLATGAKVATLEGPPYEDPVENDESIWSLAIAADGRTAVSGGESGILRVWDLDDNTYIASLEGHRGVVTSVAITRDGRRALSTSMDESLRLWNLDTCDCIVALKEHACAVALTPDERYAVSGNEDSTLRMWDLATHACVATMEGHGECVYAVAITPDGRYAVSGSSDHTLRIWDLHTHACTATLEGHASMVNCLAITPDGRYAVSGADDCTLRLWDLATHTCVATKEGHQGTVMDVIITPDGRRAVASTRGTPQVWDLVAALGAARAAHQ